MRGRCCLAPSGTPSRRSSTRPRRTTSCAASRASSGKVRWGSSAGTITHDRQVHDLSTKVRGVADGRRRVPSRGQPSRSRRSSDERRLITESVPKPAPAPRLDALVPSDAAPAPPSSPISKESSPSPQPGMGDGHQDPDSSPPRSPSRRSDAVVEGVGAAAFPGPPRRGSPEGRKARAAEDEDAATIGVLG
ncbi:hypothetical protein C2845_PM12G28230 [Panicum miliaceum]|uniref:Uncharacterized protein n=1 Tax=Panicum miliaceum TaxID=4540 RepID=A0A3L6QK43_PANMI|nr:hypothetical protein C2845_PM12G28230 [Panicum miliaceum]